jgi:hypothetical protein
VFEEDFKDSSKSYRELMLRRKYERWRRNFMKALKIFGVFLFFCYIGFIVLDT